MEIPIFISSTFNDMHAERDCIQKRVAPYLSECLSARGVTVSVIDLRWGVKSETEIESEREARVLHVCMDAIRNARPFFVGLIGNRYGWMPSERRIQSLLKSLPKEDADILVRNNMEGTSVTEMEMLLGALGKEELLKHSIFCFRSPESYATMDEHHRGQYDDTFSPSPDRRIAAAKLAALKQKIEGACDEAFTDRASRIDYTAQWDAEKQRFEGLDDFSRQLAEVLLADIQEMLDQMEPLPHRLLSGEEGEQELFVRKKLDAFTGREKWLDRCMAFLEECRKPGVRDYEQYIRYWDTRMTKDEFDEMSQGGDACRRYELYAGGSEQPGLLLTGKSGCGKSALYAALKSRLESDGRYEVFYYSAGVGSGSDFDLMDSLSRQAYTKMQEGKSYGEYDVLFLVTQDLIASGKCPVVLIDGLNGFWVTSNITHKCGEKQLIKNNLGIIPPRIPFICTSTPEVVNALFGQTNPFLYMEDIDGFDRDEAERLIRTLLARSYKSLGRGIIDTLLDKRCPDGTYACSMPIWVRLAINLLLQLGNDDFMAMHQIEAASDEGRIDIYLTEVAQRLKPEPEALFLQIIEMACQYFAPDLTRKMLTFLAFSSQGLTVNDLSVLLDKDWDALEFDSIRYWLGELIQTDADHRISLPYDSLRRFLQRNGQSLTMQCARRYAQYIRHKALGDNHFMYDLIDSFIATDDLQALYEFTIEEHDTLALGMAFMLSLKTNEQRTLHFLYAYLSKYWSKTWAGVMDYIVGSVGQHLHCQTAERINHRISAMMEEVIRQSDLLDGNTRKLEYCYEYFNTVLEQREDDEDYVINTSIWLRDLFIQNRKKFGSDFKLRYGIQFYLFRLVWADLPVRMSKSLRFTPGEIADEVELLIDNYGWLLRLCYEKHAPISYDDIGFVFIHLYPIKRTYGGFCRMLMEHEAYVKCSQQIHQLILSLMPRPQAWDFESSLSDYIKLMRSLYSAYVDLFVEEDEVIQTPLTRIIENTPSLWQQKQ